MHRVHATLAHLLEYPPRPTAVLEAIDQIGSKFVRHATDPRHDLDSHRAADCTFAEVLTILKHLICLNQSTLRQKNWNKIPSLMMSIQFVWLRIGGMPIPFSLNKAAFFPSDSIWNFLFRAGAVQHRYLECCRPAWQHPRVSEEPEDASHFLWIERDEVPPAEIVHQSFARRRMLHRKQSCGRFPELEALSRRRLAKSFETHLPAQTNRIPKRRISAEPVHDLANRRCNHIFCLCDRQNPTLGSTLAAMMIA